MPRTFAPIEFDTLHDTGEKSNKQRRELAYRSRDGMDVALLWHPVTNEIVVRVWDQRQSHRFDVRPHPHDALDAYYHPYEYYYDDVALD
jgi:hypothetical protein